MNLAIGDCRRLVGSFRHSEVLTRKLKQIDLKYDSKTKLVQEVPTRWNSTFCMIDSLLVSKDALSTLSYSDTTVKRLILIHDDFNLLDKLSNLLFPLYELTVSYSGQHYSTSSILYPRIYRLINYDLQETSLTTLEIRTFRDGLLDSLPTRFNMVLTSDVFLAATYLNYKCKTFEFIKDTSTRGLKLSQANRYLTDAWNKLAPVLSNEPQASSDAQEIRGRSSASLDSPDSDSSPSTSSSSSDPSSFVNLSETPIISTYDAHVPKRRRLGSTLDKIADVSSEQPPATPATSLEADFDAYEKLTYLPDRKDSKAIHVCNFYLHFSNNIPIMSKLARVILGMSA